MRRPNHIILDFETNNLANSSSYWALKHLVRNSQTPPSLLHDLNFHVNYSQTRNQPRHSKLYKTQQKYTIRSSKAHRAEFLRPRKKRDTANLFKPNNKFPTRLWSPGTPKGSEFVLKYWSRPGRDTYMYINLSSEHYRKQSVDHLLERSTKICEKQTVRPLNTWCRGVNINFLRKERLYTKLKYSRSPAYDIASGGTAALLAGLFGFLITEKFGYELADSGDFYYLLMYLVFLAFSTQPLLTLSSFDKKLFDLFNVKHTVAFYVSILHIFLKKFK